MSSRTQTLRCAAAAALLTLAGTEARACVACFGQSDSAMAKGMNMGIFTLLLVILSVLASIAVFFVYLVHRSSQLAGARPHLHTHFPTTPPTLNRP